MHDRVGILQVEAVVGAAVSDEDPATFPPAHDGDLAARALRDHLALADTFYARELGGRSLLPPA